MDTALQERAGETVPRDPTPQNTAQNRRSTQDQEVWLAVWQPWPAEPVRVFARR